MKIYLTRFFKYRSDNKKPMIERVGFGKDFSLGIVHFSWVFIDLISRCYKILEDIHKCSAIYKEVKFTITFKF